MGSSAKTQSEEHDGSRHKGNMNKRGPSHTGPYGLACSNCFKAKSKCAAMLGEGLSACRRCHRLGKLCQPSDSIRQRGVEKATNTSTSRIADLESKVESLLTQLRSGNNRGWAGPVRDSEEDEHVLPSIEVDCDAASHDDLDSIEANEITSNGSQNDDTLSEFRRKMLPVFPFMNLPPTITAQTLETEWPLLFRAIIFVASTSPDKISRGQNLKRLICESLLELDLSPTNMKRVDVLVAILTYLAWGADDVFYNGSMMRLMAQAVHLATEVMHYDCADSGHLMGPAAQLFGHDRQQDAGGSIRQDFFLDRRRAILGCFVLNSAVSTYFGRLNTLKWTMQMEESLAAIRSNKDCPSDEQFALLVRLQLLAERATQIHSQQKLKHHGLITDAAVSPAVMSLLALRNELQGLRAALPSAAADRELVMAHFHSVESRLSQITHAVSSTVPTMMSQFERMAASVVAGESIVNGTSQTRTARSDLMVSLWQCMQSSLDCVQALLDLEPGKFCHISFIQWSQLAHCVACLHFLANTIEDQGWDRQGVRTRIGLSAILSRVIEKLQSASKAVEPGGADNYFSLLAQKMTDLRTSTMDYHAQEHIAQREAVAAWERLKVNGGGRRASPYNVERLEDTFKRTRGPFDYVFE